LHNNILLFDCIEFNESFRCIDVIQDAAFVAMDLEARGAPIWLHSSSIPMPSALVIGELQLSCVNTCADTRMCGQSSRG
jgi:hypothetical protein